MANVDLRRRSLRWCSNTERQPASCSSACGLRFQTGLTALLRVHTGLTNHHVDHFTLRRGPSLSSVRASSVHQEGARRPWVQAANVTRIARWRSTLLQGHRI